MAGTLKIKGIVLRETRTKESDRIVTVLSREMGIINIYARRALRLKNRNNRATGLFCYSEFVVFEHRSSDLYTLNEATVLHAFHEISSQIEYLALAMYMSELVREVTVPGEMSEEILRLFLNTLHMMTSGKWKPALCKAAFEMRLMSDTGFRPDLVACNECGAYEADGFRFDVSDGTITCLECRERTGKRGMPAPMPVVMALRYLAYADLDRMFGFTLSDGYLEPLGRITERYVMVHTDKTYPTLDFYRTIADDHGEDQIEREKPQID